MPKYVYWGDLAHEHFRDRMRQEALVTVPIEQRELAGMVPGLQQAVRSLRRKARVYAASTAVALLSLIGLVTLLAVR